MNNNLNQKFKISLFLESWSISETKMICDTSVDYKDVIIYAESCCEAIVKAIKQNRGYSYLTYEVL